MEVLNGGKWIPSGAICFLAIMSYGMQKERSWLKTWERKLTEELQGSYYHNFNFFLLLLFFTFFFF